MRCVPLNLAIEHYFFLKIEQFKIMAGLVTESFHTFLRAYPIDQVRNYFL